MPVYTANARTYCTEPKPTIRKSIIRGDSKQSVKMEAIDLERKASSDPSLHLKNCASANQEYKLYIL